MSYSGHQLGTLSRALTAAFNLHRLRQMLLVQLNFNLNDNVDTSASLDVVTFHLAEAANSQG
jgi:hypothetical protein